MSLQPVLSAVATKLDTATFYSSRLHILQLPVSEPHTRDVVVAPTSEFCALTM